MFGRRKKARKVTGASLVEDGLAIFAPVAGELAPMESIDDPVFKNVPAGRGIFIRPAGDKVLSPIIGSVERLYDHGRAIRLATVFGVEILICIRHDNAEVKRNHFAACVIEGDIVGPGDLLFKLDRNAIGTDGCSTEIRMFVCDNDNIENFEAPPEKTIAEGELITVLAKRMEN